MREVNDRILKRVDLCIALDLDREHLGLQRRHEVDKLFK